MEYALCVKELPFLSEPRDIFYYLSRSAIGPRTVVLKDDFSHMVPSDPRDPLTLTYQMEAAHAIWRHDIAISYGTAALTAVRLDPRRQRMLPLTAEIAALADYITSEMLKNF
jgi:hypothetical protein